MSTTNCENNEQLINIYLYIYVYVYIYNTLVTFLHFFLTVHYIESSTLSHSLTLYPLSHILYSINFDTTPAPTVLPPSLNANLNPSAIGTALVRLTSIFALSPGTTISTLSGKWISPVTSAVRKKNCGLYIYRCKLIWDG